MSAAWHDDARRLRGEGAGLKWIAEKFRVSVARVWQVAGEIACPVDHRRAAALKNIRLARLARGRRRPSKWRPEQDAYLGAHYNCDQSAATIGRHLGFSRNAVIGRAHRLGLARPA